MASDHHGKDLWCMRQMREMIYVIELDGGDAIGVGDYRAGGGGKRM